MNTIELNNERHTKREFARLKSVLACASKDESRYVITKVLVEKAEDGITVTATDGKRLRSDRFSLEAEPGIYDIKLNSARAIFLVGNDENLVYPNFRQVVPASTDDTAYPALYGIQPSRLLEGLAGTPEG